MAEIGLIDWGILIVYSTLIFFGLFFYKSRKSNQKEYRYFLSGFAVKIFGGVAFALIYIFYYGFGDTFLYHSGASVLSDTFFEDPEVYIRLLFSEGTNLQGDLSQYSQLIPYSRTYEEWFMVKLISPLTIISFNSYLVVTLFLSFISFFGAWKLFKVFNDIFKGEHRLIAFIGAFLIPSVVFWGSGILKDTVTLAALNYLMYLSYFTIFKKKFSFVNYVLIALMAWIIIKLKAYIFLAFLPGLILGTYLSYKQSIRSRVLQILVGPTLFIALSVGAISLMSSFLSLEGKYNIDSLENRVKGFHSWHQDVGGSSYDLGEVEYTATGVVTKIPAALNVTFFRPYLWEARNPVILVGALESLSFLALFLSALVISRFRLFKVLKDEPFLYGMLFFCLIFGFAVGFTSYNFGALARYKIPLFSVGVMILVYVILQVRAAKMSKTKSSLESFDPDRSKIADVGQL